MTDSSPESGKSQPDGDDPTLAPRKMHWLFIAIPAATFVVGLLVGGLVVAVGNDGESEPDASQTPTTSPTATSSEDTAVVVPKDCVQAAETIQEATQLIRDDISAIRDFNAGKIVDLLNELEDLTNQANEQARTCSDIEINPTNETPSATP